MSNPTQIINESAMTRMQVVVVIIAIGLNALDGFDILSISFAAPGIAAEWDITRAALGIVLSMELIGMCVGSVTLGGLADTLGRRKTILGCLCLMTLGMFMVTTTNSLTTLSIWRVVTGLGIGGMLAATNPMAAEFSNRKHRHLCLSLVVIGYPIGGVLGGTVVVPLLQQHDWRSVFYFGAFATALFIPLVYFLVPESVQWLAQKQPANALARANHALQKLGYPPATHIAAEGAVSHKSSVLDIFTPKLFATTLLVTLAYFFHITTFYFILKWSPKIVVDMGFAPSSAATVLTWASVGGALGGALFGFLASRVGLKRITVITLLISVFAVALFGQSPPELNTLVMLATFGGFLTNAGIVGLYSLFAHVFPTQVRGFGTGFAIGAGRGGAVISPMVAGFLFDAGTSLHTVAIVMAMGSLLAAFAVMLLKVKDEYGAQIN